MKYRYSSFYAAMNDLLRSCFNRGSSSPNNIVYEIDDDTGYLTFTQFNFYGDITALYTRLNMLCNLLIGRSFDTIFYSVTDDQGNSDYNFNDAFTVYNSTIFDDFTYPCLKSGFTLTLNFDFSSYPLHSFNSSDYRGVEGEILPSPLIEVTS